MYKQHKGKFSSNQRREQLTSLIATSSLVPIQVPAKIKPQISINSNLEQTKMKNRVEIKQTKKT